MAVTTAFDAFRSSYGPAWGPRDNVIRHESEKDLLPESEGLDSLVDGPGEVADAERALAPLRRDALPGVVRLWVVRPDDVVHAEEVCNFGTARPAGKLKHTNMTAGHPAFSGGELLFLEDGKLIISGDSGRYGPRNAEEMRDVAIAFKKSGYTVYSLGYDDEAARALPLVSAAPQLV